MNALSRLLNLPWYVKYPLFGIYVFAVWAALFTSTCQSDGCIGAVIPLGVTILLAAVQPSLPCPRTCIRRRGVPTVRYRRVSG